MKIMLGFGIALVSFLSLITLGQAGETKAKMEEAKGEVKGEMEEAKASEGSEFGGF
jgi:hypothetical protein